MNANHYQLNKLYLNDMKRQAEQERLARLANDQPNRLSAALLAPLGRALVESGTHLLELSQREETVSASEQIAYRAS